MKLQLPQMSRKKWIGLMLLALLLLLVAKAWNDTMSGPTVLRTTVTLEDMPAGSPPMTIALISDIHVSGPDMPPERLETIVDQINALQPDLVAIAGDLVSEKKSATRIYSAGEVVAPLAKLDAGMGVVMVPGNHDHWFDWPALKGELQSNGIHILENSAKLFGPVLIGGLDDAYTGRDDLEATLEAFENNSGAKVLLSHSPDPFADLPETVPLMLAGHTHCGQIAYPWGGAPAYMSRYGDRYACGRVDEDDKTLVVGAGLGTSLIPLRLFTQPEIWLIEIGPPHLEN